MGALPPFLYVCACVCSVLVFRKRMGVHVNRGGREGGMPGSSIVNGMRKYMYIINL